MRQTLYQVGTLCITKENVNQPLLKMNWRDDIEEICKAYTCILKAMTDTQKERPFLYKASAMLGEISSYLLSLQTLCTYDRDALNECSRSLAKAAISWAKEYDDEIEKASPEQRSSLRSRQVIFYRTSILCVVHGNIDTMSAEIILTCTVRAHNMFVHNNDDAHERELLRELCEYSLSNRLCEYFHTVIQNDGTILSRALKTVITSVPSVSHWKRENTSDASFSAYDLSEQCYSINALTGVILVNGLPPNQLPLSITGDKLYQKVFASNNFEVIVTTTGYFQTTYAIFGCYYRFHKAANGNVVIQESSHVKFDDTDPWSNSLELLSLSSLQHFSNFPKKLQTSFSHWVSRRQNIIVFRLFNFREREIYYGHNMSQCKTVPKYFHGRDDWRSIMNKFDQMDSLVVHKS